MSEILGEYCLLQALSTARLNNHALFHVRYPQNDSSPYMNSFERHYNHPNRHPTAEVDDWKNALEEICSRSGWSKDFSQGSDARLIMTVVHDVIKALDQRTNPGTMQFPIQRSVSPQQCPKNWSQGRVLGKGSFGIVYEGLNRDDGSHFAVKISDVESLEVRQEIDILQKLNHPNIVRYLGSSVHEGRLCIFLELVMMGSLRHVLDIYKQFEENTIRMYSRQILRGLEYLHYQNIIHRDLKCANILLHSNGQVKLADFGLAKQMSQSLANSCKGTPLYMAPEMITLSKEERKYGKEVDIWSLGCTLIEMAGGKPPWSDLEGFSFLFKLKRGELPPILDHLSEEAKNFLGMCLRVKPEDRAIVSELLQHPFVTNAPAVAPLFTHHSELLQHLSVTNAPAVA